MNEGVERDRDEGGHREELAPVVEDVRAAEGEDLGREVEDEQPADRDVDGTVRRTSRDGGQMSSARNAVFRRFRGVFRCT